MHYFVKVWVMKHWPLAGTDLAPKGKAPMLCTGASLREAANRGEGRLSGDWLS